MESSTCKYLNEDFDRAGTVQATLMYDIQTTRQVVDGIRGKLNKALLEDVKGTHVITDIEWGMRCYITCKKELVDDEDEISVKNHVKAVLENLKHVLNNDDLNNEFNLERDLDLSFYIYCNIGNLTRDVTYDFNNTKTKILNIKGNLRHINGGRGVPVCLTMMPLKILRKCSSLKRNQKLCFIRFQWMLCARLYKR